MKEGKHFSSPRINPGACIQSIFLVHGGNAPPVGVRRETPTLREAALRLRVAPVALCRGTRPPLRAYRPPLRAYRLQSTAPQAHYLTTATASAIRTKPAYPGYKS